MGVASPDSWRDGIVGDFNGDGRDDIAEYQPSTGTWEVLLSTGNGFNRSEFYDFSVENPQWGAFHVGDFDGDGNDDILHHDLVTENLHVLFSDGAAFTPKLWETLPSDSTWTLRNGDFDGDGSHDAAAFDGVGGGWWVMLAQGDRTGSDPVVWWTFQSTNFVDHVVGDFNGDGRDDIANLAGNRQMKVLTAKAAGGFKWGNGGTTPKGQGASHVLALDADDDGDDDVITYNPTTKALHIHTSNGTSFTVQWWGSLLK